MTPIDRRQLYEWCKIPFDQLEGHPDLKIPFRLCQDSADMGQIMARELVDEIKTNNDRSRQTHAIIPCGPTCWYQPFTKQVNQENVSLRDLIVFHMDECLDWQGGELPWNNPFNFRRYMQENFYNPIRPEIAVLDENRRWLNGRNLETIREQIAAVTVDITYGGWGQDGHVAYNQTRRHPFSQLTLDDLRNATARIQDNNIDTIIALAQRNIGCAYQFVPPMSVTLGIKECLSARKVRLFSDTGAWKQTALRVALFGPLTPEYPITLLQEHPDALLTATIETAKHPISLHPDWDLGV